MNNSFDRRQPTHSLKHNTIWTTFNSQWMSNSIKRRQLKLLLHCVQQNNIKHFLSLTQFKVTCLNSSVWRLSKDVLVVWNTTYGMFEIKCNNLSDCSVVRNVYSLLRLQIQVNSLLLLMMLLESWKRIKRV